MAEADDPRDDIIEDRAINDATKDHFGHAQFAGQAAKTIRAIETPANIAIYAPWGSGKTSLAHLIEREVRGTDCGFVYFDAFKYADVPLRREFIRNVASKLDVDDPKYSTGLYEEKTDNQLNLENKTIQSVLKIVGLVVGPMFAFCVGLGALLAELSHKGFVAEWVFEVRELLLSVFAPTVLIAPVLALIGAQLKVTRKRFAPESDEEFERLFRSVRSLLDYNSEGSRMSSCRMASLKQSDFTKATLLNRLN